MRVLMLGFARFGAAVFEAVRDAGHDVVALATHETRPERITGYCPPDLSALAGEAGVPSAVIAPGERDMVHRFAGEHTFDLVLAVNWRGWIQTDVLDLAPQGGVNLHGSLLPAYRGNAPMTWAIIHGERTLGVTAHRLAEEIDAGTILGQRSYDLASEETIADAYDRSEAIFGPLTVEVLDALERGEAVETPQDESRASRFGRRRPEGGVIDWSVPAHRVHDWVRAQTSPLPGAFTHAGLTKVIVWRTEVVDERTTLGTPGRILETDGSSVTVAAGQGAVRLVQTSSGERYGDEGAELITQGVLQAGGQLGQVLSDEAAA
ncbi:MAG: methionyl-tRNA formyltransferase [Planctomycetota bacterium]